MPAAFLSATESIFFTQSSHSQNLGNSLTRYSERTMILRMMRGVYLAIRRHVDLQRQASALCLGR
jgi:hypothetical protein